MFGMGRQCETTEPTDLQSRLRVIQQWARSLRGGSKKPPASSEGEIAVLAYLVDYLAGIVEKHLREGEK